MIIKQNILGFLLVASMLLAACTATGSSPVTEREAVVTAAGATAVPPTPTTQPAILPLKQVVHNGISFTYDSASLGDVNIWDIPATSNEGMFEMPTPAHTWIGFVPDGIQRDATNHWQLTREPQLLVFNLNDFGSFAPADEQARQKVAGFQQVLAARPSTFDDEISVLPPINAAQMIRAHVKWLDFGTGTGIRFVAEYDQDNLPLINDRLVYVFYGMTSDGLHGVTAVFPLTNTFLPNIPLTEADQDRPFDAAFVAEKLATFTSQVNDLADDDFTPMLSQLDALVQSLTILPDETDYVVTDVTPKNAQMLGDSNVFDAPNGETVIDTLSVGEAVVVNGHSTDGRYSRILCIDGSTSNCWIASDAVQVTDMPISVAGISSGPVDGQVVQIQAIIENVIFSAPDETAAPLGSFRVGEVAEVYATDESGNWYNIACPRNIGVNCWVIADTAVNEPIGFYSSDGWKPMAGNYVSFRVPIEWATTAVSSGGGSILEQWNLGIPGNESDQDIAFFAVAFDDLEPPDIITETPFEISGQPGVKWVRGGEGYVSYDYYTTGIAGAGSFGIHVTVPAADPELEAVMDRLAASVIFTP